jgi:DNA primase
VHPVRQIYHCFGCGVGGDVFKFVMEMEKMSFPEAIRAVAEKCGIAIPKPRERSPEERQRKSAAHGRSWKCTAKPRRFFAAAIECHAGRPGGESVSRRPRTRLRSNGAIRHRLRAFGRRSVVAHDESKYQEKVLEASGLFSRDAKRALLYEVPPRRVMFPIANESGKIVAFGGRAHGRRLAEIS